MITGKTLSESKYLGEALPEIIEMIDDDMILTPKDVSELIGKSAETVRRWCRSGKLQTLGGPGHFRISGKALKRFIFSKYIA